MFFLPTRIAMSLKQKLSSRSAVAKYKSHHCWKLCLYLCVHSLMFADALCARRGNLRCLPDMTLSFFKTWNYSETELLTRTIFNRTIFLNLSLLLELEPRILYLKYE